MTGTELGTPAAYPPLPDGITCAAQVDQGVWLYMLASAGGVPRGEIRRVPRDKASALFRGHYALPWPAS